MDIAGFLQLIHLPRNRKKISISYQTIAFLINGTLTMFTALYVSTHIRINMTVSKYALNWTR